MGYAFDSPLIYFASFAEGALLEGIPIGIFESRNR